MVCPTNVALVDKIAAILRATVTSVNVFSMAHAGKFGQNHPVGAWIGRTASSGTPPRRPENGGFKDWKCVAENKSGKSFCFLRGATGETAALSLQFAGFWELEVHP